MFMHRPKCDERPHLPRIDHAFSAVTITNSPARWSRSAGEQMKLNPVPSRRIMADDWIVAIVAPGLRPSLPGDPKINHVRGFQMGDLPAFDKQRRLVPVTGAALVRRASGEHGRDERVPPLVVITSGHVHDHKPGFGSP
jgi:hypothetical protein